MPNVLRPRGISSPPQVEDAGLQSWLQEVKDAIDGLPFSTFSTSDGPNQSAYTAPEGFIGVDVGSSTTKFWFKESGSTSTGWSPWDSGKVTDFNLRVAAGVVSGVSGVNKFGENDDVDTGTDPEDIWSEGGIWTPPTSASIHTIVSSNASDDGNGSGATYTGARTVKIYGLKTWDTTETAETVQLSGTSEMVTAESYVIIHRMKVVTSGTADSNLGQISATAKDGSDTSSAFIEIDHGITHMAVYGVSSLDKFYLTNWGFDLNKSGQDGTAQIDLCIRNNADVATATWLRNLDLGVSTTASSHLQHNFTPYHPVVGPAIVKLQVIEVSGSNTDISASFEGFLVKNTVVL